MIVDQFQFVPDQCRLSLCTGVAEGLRHAQAGQQWGGGDVADERDVVGRQRTDRGADHGLQGIARGEPREEEQDGVDGRRRLEHVRPRQHRRDQRAPRHRHGEEGAVVQGAAAGRPNIAAEGRQHRAADTALGDHVRHGEAALPRPVRCRGRERHEHGAATHGREWHRAVRRPHEVRQVARHRSARRPDDAHSAARHIAVLARPAERQQQGAGVGRTGPLLVTAAEVPGDALPGRDGPHHVPEAAHEADGHPQPKRGALTSSAQGQSRGHPATHAGGARLAQLTPPSARRRRTYARLRVHRQFLLVVLGDQ